MSKVTYLNSHLEKYRKEPEIRIDLEELFSEIDKIGISEFLSKWKKNN